MKYEKLTVKFTWVNIGPEIVKNSLKNKRKERGITLVHIKVYYNSKEIKNKWRWGKNRQTHR